LIDNSPWWTKYEKNGFDLTFRSNETKSMDLFKVIPIEMVDDQDVILMKLEIYKGSLNKKAEMELTFSGSEIQFLQPGTTVRGHVSNFNSTYKIYELYINKEVL